MSERTVSVPRQVQKQAEKADTELKKFRDGPTPEPEGKGPKAEPEPAPEKPVPAQPQAPQKTEPTIESLQADLAKEKQRNETLLGINRAQKGEMDQVKDRLKKLENPSAPSSPKKHLKPEEVKAIGEEAVDVTARIARGEVDPVAENVQRLEAKLNDGLHRMFLRELAAKYPASIPVNSDPDWLLWLGQREPGTRFLRQQFLDECVARQDVDETWAWFEKFLRQSGRESEIAQPEPQAPSQPKAPAPKPAPSAAKPAVTSEPKKRTFSASYVKKFMKDRALAVGRGETMSPDQKQTMSEIETAEREGRIDYTK